MNELVPPAVRELVAFYAENHPEARFGDLDVSALQQAMAGLDEAEAHVHVAEAAVAEAKEQFHAVEAELLAKASRAISFLKIHVEQDPAQVAQLEGIANGLASHRRKGKPGADVATTGSEPRQRRTRKPKTNVLADESQASSSEPQEEALALTEEPDSAPGNSEVIAADPSKLSQLSSASLS